MESLTAPAGHCHPRLDRGPRPTIPPVLVLVPPAWCWPVDGPPGGVHPSPVPPCGAFVAGPSLYYRFCALSREGVPPPLVKMLRSALARSRAAVAPRPLPPRRGAAAAAGGPPAGTGAPPPPPPVVPAPPVTPPPPPSAPGATMPMPGAAAAVAAGTTAVPPPPPLGAAAAKAAVGASGGLGAPALAAATAARAAGGGDGKKPSAAPYWAMIVVAPVAVVAMRMHADAGTLPGRRRGGGSYGRTTIDLLVGACWYWWRGD